MRWLFVLALACACPLGCASQDDKQVLAPFVMGMTENVAPAYDDGQQQIYEVHAPVELPLRRPTDSEIPQGQAAPFPRPPFHLAGDTRITVRFTLTNMTDKKITVELLLDPWNEFVRYLPGVTMGEEEETAPNFSGWDKFFPLEPKQRIEGIITADDMVELATDLATAQELQARPPAADSAFAGPTLFNRAFNLQNRSSQPDPVLAPFFPKVVPGLVGFDLGLRSYEPVKVAVELVIDVEDQHGNRVIKEEDRASVEPVGPPPSVLSPPAAPARM